MKARLYFLDNLRTFLIFLVVVLHAGIVYEPILENSWIVSDPVKNSSIGLIRLYLDIFVMFSLFFISGYFIPHSVKRNDDWTFIKSKFKRILLPWLIAVFTLIPLYKIIFLYSRGLPQEEWFSYFHFFQRAGGDMSSFADNPVQNWLWFLPVLFLFQVIYLILSKTKMLSFKIPVKTGLLLTILISLIYGISISSLNLTGWYHSVLFHFQRERFLMYFMVFLFGSLCYKHEVFSSDFKNKKLYIWANVALTLSLGVFTVVALNLFFNLVDPGRNFFFISGPVDRAVYYLFLLLSMFSFLYILIYVFRFYLNKTNKWASLLSKNSYSVYIIHVVVLGAIALPLLNVSIPALAKFLILALLTFVISNVLISVYDYLFEKKTNLKTGALAILIIGIFAFINFTNKEKPTIGPVQSGISKTDSLSSGIGLHEAVLQGNMEAIQRHIKIESDLNIKEPSGGSSPLITAAVFGKTEEALALIQAGAKVNFKNNDGSTALHSAAFFCRTEIVKALLANGVDPTIKNNTGSTALESVTVPFEEVKGIYDYFGNNLGSLGLQLDYEQIKATRPIIAEMLKSVNTKNDIVE